MRSPDGQNGPIVTRYEYSGFSTTIFDPDDNSKTQTTDHLGRIVQVVEHLDAATDYTTAYEYNAAGDLTKVTDTHNNVTNIAYDTLGRKKSMSDPDMGNWNYTYDGNGNLKTQTDANNVTITFEYDEFQNLFQWRSCRRLHLRRP